MNWIKKILDKEQIMEIIRFVITGGISFVVDYGVFFVLDKVLQINYLVSTGISFTLSVIVNYLLCIMWVFNKADKNNKKTLFVFVSTSVIGLFLNMFFMWILVSKMHILDLIAKIIATGLVMIWNYVTKKKAVE